MPRYECPHDGCVRAGFAHDTSNLTPDASTVEGRGRSTESAQDRFDSAHQFYDRLSLRPPAHRPVPPRNATTAATASDVDAATLAWLRNAARPATST